MTFVVLLTTRSPVTQLRIRCFQCGASRTLMKINALNLRQQAKERNFALRVWVYPQDCPFPASRTNETRQVSHHNTSERWHRLLSVTWQLFLTLYHCVEKRARFRVLFVVICAICLQDQDNVYGFTRVIPLTQFSWFSFFICPLEPGPRLTSCWCLQQFPPLRSGHGLSSCPFVWFSKRSVLSSFASLFIWPWQVVLYPTWHC